MGVSIVVGGQFGSEGKGKTARYFARKYRASAVVRVGGINSGHTVIGSDGKPVIFRSLPTAAMDGEALCVLPAGSYLDVELLFREIGTAGLPASKVKIHPHAVVITEEQVRMEREAGLAERIGSTGTGTGAAVSMRAFRDRRLVLAKDVKKLAPFLCDTGALLRGELDQNREVLIEGTQGFGLSNLHSPYFPKATSRDTTAAGFLSEAGLSPFDVTHVIMVIRTYPIRVPGDSGGLPNEMTWDEVTARSGRTSPIREYTSVTKKERRVGGFDPDIVLRAIAANRPDQIVLNHLDYIPGGESGLSEEQTAFVDRVQSLLRARVDCVGTGPETLHAL